MEAKNQSILQTKVFAIYNKRVHNSEGYLFAQVYNGTEIDGKQILKGEELFKVVFKSSFFSHGVGRPEKETRYWTWIFKWGAIRQIKKGQVIVAFWLLQYQNIQNPACLPAYNRM